MRIEGRVKAVDFTLTPLCYAYMDFLAQTDVVYATIEKTATPGEFHFRSEVEGLVDITFTVATQAIPVTKASKSRQILVFPPFRVIPESLSLLVGETAEVRWKGGPYEGIEYKDKLNITYKVSVPSIASMYPGKNIVLGRSLGVTTIRLSPKLITQEEEDYDVFADFQVTVRQINGNLTTHQCIILTLFFRDTRT